MNSQVQKTVTGLVIVSSLLQVINFDCFSTKNVDWNCKLNENRAELRNLNLYFKVKTCSTNYRRKILRTYVLYDYHWNPDLKCINWTIQISGLKMAAKLVRRLSHLSKKMPKSKLLEFTFGSDFWIRLIV